MSTLTYAIDFGTSNTLLGAADANGPRGFAPLDPTASDPLVLRSLLYFPNASQVFYGREAIQKFSENDQSGRFIRSIKRQLPRRSFVGTYVDNRPFNLEDLIGVFLGEIRRRANAHFGADVTRVVLGRPARFAMDDADDQYAESRLERAARIAGFTDIEFFPEPIAAAFGFDAAERSSQGPHPARGERIILAADYGGGTSDFTVYRLRPSDGSGSIGFRREDVLALGGIPLAGDALDSALMRQRISPHFGTGVRYTVPFGSNTLTMPVHLMERICHPGEISLLRKQDTLEFLRNVQQWSLGPADRAKMDRLFILLEDQLGFPLFERIEATKLGLSQAQKAAFEFRYPGIELREEVTRAQFEDYASSCLQSLDQSLIETLRRSGLEASQIDQVLCTGGTAKVPWIRQSLIGRFGQDKLYDLDPFRGVAQGLMARAEEWARNCE